MIDQAGKSACDWALDVLGCQASHIEAIGSDASRRRYFRLFLEPNQAKWLTDGPRPSLILMDAPPKQEPLGPFIDIQKRLAEIGLHVPSLLHVEETQGWMVLSDLGSDSYLDRLNRETADGLFEDAHQALLAMQSRASTEGLDAYDAPRLLAEMSLFTDWFLTHHWGVEPTDDEWDQWDLLCALIIRWALDQSTVFCHRDFMPRNLMVSQPNPGLLDFQDAVIGPVSYDPISLYMDAFIDWPRSYVDQALERYRQQAKAHGMDVPDHADLWRRMCDLMSIQRHLKVIGIFARIAYRDGKPRYLRDVGRFFNYITETAQRNPELEALTDLIKTWESRKKVGQL